LNSYGLLLTFLFVLRLALEEVLKFEVGIDQLDEALGLQDLELYQLNELTDEDFCTGWHRNVVDLHVTRELHGEEETPKVVH
jgi:hypothetical protein